MERNHIILRRGSPLGKKSKFTDQIEDNVKHILNGGCPLKKRCNFADQIEDNQPNIFSTLWDPGSSYYGIGISIVNSVEGCVYIYMCTSFIQEHPQHPPASPILVSPRPFSTRHQYAEMKEPDEFYGSNRRYSKDNKCVIPTPCKES